MPDAQPYPAAFARTAEVLPLAADRTGRVYIAGPMTGLPEFNYPLFNLTARVLRSLGWHVENPAEHGIVVGAEWSDYTLYGIGRLSTCSNIHLLPGWSKSLGARLEMHVARAVGLEVQYAHGAERPPLDGLDARR